MILSHGVEEHYENKEKFIRYKFFIDFATKYGDGIYGLDSIINQLVNTFKSAANAFVTVSSPRVPRASSKRLGSIVTATTTALDELTTWLSNAEVLVLKFVSPA